MQFIAATHSPILIASCKNGQLIRVEKDEITYDTSGYGMEINDVLCSTQHSRDMVETVKEQLDTVYKLINDEQFDQAKLRISAMKETLGDSHPEINKVITAYEFEKAMAENEE